MAVSNEIDHGRMRFFSYYRIIFYHALFKRSIVGSMEISVKIEPGKFYKTRDGRKARIYAVGGLGSFPAHGAICYGTDMWEVATWHLNGCSHVLSSGTCEADIVAEWTAPAPRLIAWLGISTSSPYFTKSENEKPSAGEWRRAPWLDEPEVKP